MRVLKKIVLTKLIYQQINKKFEVFRKNFKCFIDVILFIRYNVEGQLLFMTNLSWLHNEKRLLL